MDKEEYTRRVLNALRHVTGSEYEDVRHEITGHIEDRMEALIEAGCSEEEAERRTVDAMGNPEKVGTELSKQYQSFLWVILGRLFIWLAVAVVGFCAIRDWGVLGRYYDNLVARFAPTYGDNKAAPEELVSTDIRIRVGDDVLYIYQMGVWEIGERKNVQMRAVAYDRFPGGVVSRYLPASVRLEDGAGEEVKMVMDWSKSSYYYGYVQYHLGLGAEDESVVVCIDRFGEGIRQEITLPEVTP